ncbi:flippase [Methanolobus sp. ZRKC4]
MILGIGEVQRQSIAAFLSQISFTMMGFFSTMYFAHTVGASILGGYFLFIAYYGIINMITDGGLGGAAIKRISEGDEQNAYFTTFFVLRCLFVTIVISLLIAFRESFIEFNEAGTFNWLILALLVSLFHGLVTNGISGNGKVGIYAVSNFMNNASRIAIQVIGIFLGYGVAGLTGGFIAGLLVSTVIALRFLDLGFSPFKWVHIKRLTAFSFWLFLTSTGVLLYSQTDTIMIGYFMDNFDVGVYRVVFQFTTLATIATTAFRLTLWPKVSKWSKKDENGLIEESLSKACTYSLTIAIPIFAGGILLGDQLLYFFYGQDFASGYYTFVILLFVQIVNIYQFFFTMYLGAQDRQKDSFKVTAAAAITNVLLNFILIPIIGILGAAIATLFTMGLNALLARKILSKMITIKIEYDSLLNTLKAATVMALLIGVYRAIIPLSNIWITLIPVFLGGATYSILVLKFDHKINEELKGILGQMNIPWPSWL